jgi:RNA polymerase sigma factor (sigma-70 family)
MATGQLNGVLQHLRRAMLLQDGAGRTDGQLLADYLSRRDEAALEALVQRHGPMVWGVCRRVLRNYHDAEDAFQATFLVLVRKAASLASPELLANWLYGVAHQTALKARATAAKRKVRERQVTEMPESTVAAQDLWDDLRPLLDEELSCLPDVFRVVLVLCDLGSKTRKEAARHLGLPEGTVASRLARARAMLAKRLAQRGVVLSDGALATLLLQNVASAGVPNLLVSSTLNAASQFAAGHVATAGVTSANVVALTEGVLQIMVLNKVKLGAALVGLAAMTLGALGLVSAGARAELHAVKEEAVLPSLVAAPPAPEPLGAAQADARKPARIFVTVSLRENDNLVNQVIAVDPQSGKWTKIADGGGRVRVAPDGQTLLMGRAEGIWNCDTQGGNNPGQISDKGYAAVWSPDGKQIVVAGGKQTQGKWQVENWLMNADGSKPTRLPIPEEDHVHDWSPDGKWLVTVSDRDRIRINRTSYINYGYQLYLMKPDGSEQRRLTEGGINLQPRFSPDGKRLLYSYTRPDRVEGGWWLRDVDGGNPREIFRREDLVGSDTACWSPDGKHLALILFDWSLDEQGRRVLKTDESANHRIEILDADGKNRRELKLDNLKPVFLSDPDWR